MKRTMVCMLVSAVVLMFVMGGGLCEEFANQLSYRGTVYSRSDSEPVSGEYEVAIKVYGDSTGREELWSEVHERVMVEDGAFQVVLGRITELPGSVFDGRAIWIETTFDGVVMEPRQRVYPVGYALAAKQALHSQHAETAGGLVGADGAPLGTPNYIAKFTGESSFGNSVMYEDVGKIGIGTMTPSHRLEVAGEVSATTYYGDGSNLENIAGAPDDDWVIDGDNVYREAGNVGILTSVPAEALDVAGTIQAAGFKMPTGAEAGHILTSDGSGVGTWQPNGGDDLPPGTSGQTLRHDGTGWTANSLLSNDGSGVGIGTSSPRTNLEVRGTDPAIRVSQVLPRTSWMQMRYDRGLGPLIETTPDPQPLGTVGTLMLDADADGPGYIVLGRAGDKVGIGTRTPAEKLDVGGTIRVEGFSMPAGASDGYVLTSDGFGWGTWEAPVSDGEGTVTSISQGTGIVCTPNPITTAGTVAFDQSWGDARYIKTVTAGDGLGGGGTSGSVTLDVKTGTGLQISSDAVGLTSAYSTGSAYDSRFITAVYADNGLTGGATQGTAHLNVGEGPGIDVSANSVAVNVSEFDGDGLVAQGTNDLEVNTGTGLTISSDKVQLTTTYSDGSAYDSRFVKEGQSGSVTSDMIVDGTIDERDMGFIRDGSWFVNQSHTIFECPGYFKVYLVSPDRKIYVKNLGGGSSVRLFYAVHEVGAATTSNVVDVSAGSVTSFDLHTYSVFSFRVSGLGPHKYLWFHGDHYQGMICGYYLYFGP